MFILELASFTLPQEMKYGLPELLGIVQEGIVAGLIDLNEFSLGHRPRHFQGCLGFQDIAFPATEYQGGARNAGNKLPPIYRLGPPSSEDQLLQPPVMFPDKFAGEFPGKRELEK